MFTVCTGIFWFDASGNPIKSFPAGSSLFTKTTYDSLGRPTVQYSAYGADSTYADASSVANNTVLEQGETTYDADSNAIQVTSRQRYHNAVATQLGALQNPGVTPNARVTYVAQYPDPIGRLVNSANYGTNGGTSLSRPATAPVRSDTVLVSSVSYDSAGNTLQTTDPAGMVTRFEYDAVGRTTRVTENYVATSSSSSSARSSSSSSSSSGVGACTASDDTNRVTRFTYTPDGKQATLVAENIRTGNQTTTYTYGTTLVESTVATSTLLRYVNYPDSTGGSDRVAYTYDRQGETVTVTDQRGCVHSYVYDALGRLTNDCVTTLGTGVDGAVRRLTAAYEVRGLTSKLTSYDNATVGSGSIVNDVALTYNSFGQIVSDAQSHSGTVVPGTTPQVQYAYANGSSNMIRPTTLTYPNGRAITISYGTASGISDSASRVDGLIDGGTTLVNYSYLGLGTAVQTTYPQPGIQYTLLGSSGGTSPAGDIYWGLDLFGRIIDSRWFNTGTSADVDRIKYGYDRASNRIWRQNPVATAAGANFDEYYTNDGLQRLKDMKRGTLNGTNTGITSPTFEQCWTLDPTGNWRGFNEAASGTAWTLNQARSANTVNEITGITNTTGSAWSNPAYDTAGNMTTMPQPAAPGSSYTATYDAWNRLVKLVDTGTSQTVQQNQYDARTFRTVVLTYAAGVLSETRHAYFTSGWRCIEERVGTVTTADKQFVWGARYTDDLVLRDRGSERLYALQDANWNVTSIANGSGTVQERYSYSAYGTPTYLTGSFGVRALSGFLWETLYSGYRIDSTVTLYLSRYRFYGPTIGTWITRDRAGYVDSTNLLQYGLNAPQSTVDPYGLDSFLQQTISEMYHPKRNPLVYLGLTPLPPVLTPRHPYDGPTIRPANRLESEAANEAMWNNIQTHGWINALVIPGGLGEHALNVASVRARGHNPYILRPMFPDSPSHEACPVRAPTVAMMPYDGPSFDASSLRRPSAYIRVVIYRAPARGTGQRSLHEGFHPRNFPRGPYTNGNVYFARQRSLAEEYNYHYREGVLEVYIPMDEYDTRVRQYESPYLSDPQRTEIPIPHEGFDVLNRAERRLFDQ